MHAANGLLITQSTRVTAAVVLGAAALAGCTAAPASAPAPAIVVVDTGSVFGSIEVAAEAMDAEAMGVSMANQLVAAAGSDDGEELVRLIDAGADVNERNWRGFTALMASAYYGHTEATSILLTAGARPDMRGGFSWPLMTAMTEGHQGVMAALLKAGADPDLSDAKGRTALMLAARDGLEDAAEMLIAHGADVDAVSLEAPPANALVHALRTGNTRIAGKLLRAGATTRMPDGSPGSALDIAVSARDNLERFLADHPR